MPGSKPLPLPPHFKTHKASEVWPVHYQQLAIDAENWAKKYHLQNSILDKKRIALQLVDCQNVFCLPDYELCVAGKSGHGAIEDSVRICEFIYRNLNMITGIIVTMDTHSAMQIFHPIFWINQHGEHPTPYTIISSTEIKQKKWYVNPAILSSVTEHDLNYLQQYVIYYATSLENRGKYPLTIWPYHAMLGSISHALVSSIEEACFFHTIARKSQTRYEIKGRHPLTEHYSVLSPEVLTDQLGHPIAEKNSSLIEELLEFDMLIIAGQAKSHCLAWSVKHLLEEIMQRDPKLAKKVYLLEDCTSSVVVPNVIDYTDQANERFKKFAHAGMNIVKSTTPIQKWPGYTS